LASHDANPGVVNGMQRRTDGDASTCLLSAHPRESGDLPIADGTTITHPLRHRRVHSTAVY
jgi:hypothetical protein